MSVAAPPSPIETAGEIEPVRIDGRPVRRPPGLLGARAAMDGLACLAIAVLMLRSFLVEGYMISTGSMAPALYGYHKRVVCPSCGELFARGVAFDGASALADDELSGGGRYAVCPNCGQASIDVSDVPRNHGDQLLVLKNAYEFRSPRRWEVVVFRNPNHPTQAFVKRIGGLPGEQVQIIDGDLYADGEICRKSLETQQAMRIPVYEADHAPHDAPERTPRWKATAGWTIADKAEGRVFRFEPAVDSAGPDATSGGAGEPAWLTYQHRYRSGGMPESSVVIDGLPLGFALPETLAAAPVRYQSDFTDPSVGTLTAYGALSAADERHLRELSAEPVFRQAVADLAARSRVAPIIDRYGYNRTLGLTPHVVRDVMLSANVQLSGEGAFAIELTDGRDRVRVVAETASRSLSLVRTTTGERLRSAPLPAALFEDGGALIEVSMMDRQVLVAVAGAPVFAAWTYDEPREIAPPTSCPVRIGATGLEATLRSLTLYRDVYYTPGKEKNGIREPYPLEEDEFFVLGDNSPVSLDSRSWDDGALPERMLLGKPFVVHLPSRPGTFQIGGVRRTMRIPDFSRIRYIY